MADYAPDHPTAVAFAKRMDQAVQPHFHKSVVAIVANTPEGKTVQQGTGTLFRVANTSFLVTASHVVHRKEERDIFLFTGGPTGEPVLRQEVWERGMRCRKRI